MSVKYDFYKNPIPHNSERRKRMHARVTGNGTINSEAIAKRIQESCSLTVADVTAALSALTDAMVHELIEGKQVHINGFGYFQVTLECPPVKTPKDIRAESIHFKSVSFRPEQALKDRLKNLKVSRSPEKVHSSELTDIEVDILLTDYFKDHTYILRRTFESLCGFTKYMALLHLNKLLAAGKLQKEGLYNSPIYTPSPGCYHVKR